MTVVYTEGIEVYQRTFSNDWSESSILLHPKSYEDAIREYPQVLIDQSGRKHFFWIEYPIDEEDTLIALLNGKTKTDKEFSQTLLMDYDGEFSFIELENFPFMRLQRSGNDTLLIQYNKDKIQVSQLTLERSWDLHQTFDPVTSEIFCPGKSTFDKYGIPKLIAGSDGTKLFMWNEVAPSIYQQYLVTSVFKHKS